jgi:hypothetical protein
MDSDTGRMVHINLPPHIITLWAAHIVNGDAVLHYPPRQIAEIDKLMRDAMKPRPPKWNSRSETSRNAVDLPVNVLLNVSSQSAEPATPIRRNDSVKASLHAFTPISMYTAKDYTGDALLAYLEWLERKYNDSEYVEAFDKLRAKKIGVDLLNKLTVDDVLKWCPSLSPGTAMHIVKCLSDWKASLNVSTSLFCNDGTDF